MSRITLSVLFTLTICVRFERGPRRTRFMSFQRAVYAKKELSNMPVDLKRRDQKFAANGEKKKKGKNISQYLPIQPGPRQGQSTFSRRLTANTNQSLITLLPRPHNFVSQRLLLQFVLFLFKFKLPHVLQSKGARSISFLSRTIQVKLAHHRHFLPTYFSCALGQLDP